MDIMQKKEMLLDVALQFDLNRVLELAQTYIEFPICVVDNTYKILGHSSGFADVSADTKEIISNQYLDREMVEEMLHDYMHIKKEHVPILGTDRYGREWIICFVYVHNIAVAHIGVAVGDGIVGEDTLILLEFLTKLVGLEISKTNTYMGEAGELHSQFLSELLDYSIRDIGTIIRRANILKWNLGENLRILTIFQEYSDRFDRKSQLIFAEVKKLFPSARWAIYDGHVVCLLSLETPHISLFRPHKHLEHFLEVNNLTASLSRSFHSLLDVRDFYKESLAAWQLGQRLKHEKRLHIYTDYLCQHIGGILAEDYMLSNFYHPAIKKIKAYDTEHKSALLETLKMYLTYPDNPTQVAAHLFIHKNTLFYRLNKIRDIFSIDLSNGEERLALHISLKFMELE